MHLLEHPEHKDKELKEKIFDDSELLSKDDSGLWSIMQYYEEEYGKRMIDVTSSFFCALYFVCVNWDGSIDTSIDGKLYLFPYTPGREETQTPDTYKGQINGPEDQAYNSLDDYFKVDSSVKYLRFIISAVRNERALSQDWCG